MLDPVNIRLIVFVNYTFPALNSTRGSHIKRERKTITDLPHRKKQALSVFTVLHGFLDRTAFIKGLPTVIRVFLCCFRCFHQGIAVWRLHLVTRTRSVVVCGLSRENIGGVLSTIVSKYCQKQKNMDLILCKTITSDSRNTLSPSE